LILAVRYIELDPYSRILTVGFTQKDTYSKKLTVRYMTAYRQILTVRYIQ